MYFHHVYSTLLFVSGAIALLVLRIAVRRRTSIGGKTLIGMMLAMTIWSWMYALHWAFPTWPARFFWLDATYIGVVAIPVLVLIFAINLTKLNFKFKKKYVILFSIIPVLTLIILWTDPYTNLFFGGQRSSSDNSIYSGGVWFWISIIYDYGLLITGLIYMISAWVRIRGGIYRAQLTYAIMGVSIPLLVSMLGIAGFHPLPGLDLIPFSFIISGIFFLISLHIFHFLDLIPIAHDALIDHMSDGMIVLDTKKRVVDANNSACRLLDTKKPAIVGRTIDEVVRATDLFPDWTGLEEAPAQVIMTFSEMADMTLDVQINPLLSDEGEKIGYLIVWRDITELKRVEDELRATNIILIGQLQKIEVLQKELLEEVVRDPLTGAFNRRFLEKTLPKELNRAKRQRTPISFLILDIDHFKLVNDQFGHDIGDKVLRSVANKLEEITRAGDWVVRYGGEEFLVALVGSDLHSARQKAEAIREEINNLATEHQGCSIKVTISIGIAEYPVHGKDSHQILKAADAAMYLAKTDGRNCIRQAN